jgi:hypothetical protein
MTNAFQGALPSPGIEYPAGRADTMKSVLNLMLASFECPDLLHYEIGQSAGWVGGSHLSECIPELLEVQGRKGRPAVISEPLIQCHR